MELLSPMAVMSEGLGFNLCVAPFLNVCVLNLSRRVGVKTQTRAHAQIHTHAQIPAYVQLPALFQPHVPL